MKPGDSAVAEAAPQPFHKANCPWKTWRGRVVPPATFKLGWFLCLALVVAQQHQACLALDVGAV